MSLGTSRKPGGTEIMWDTSSAALCRLCESTRRYQIPQRKNTETLIDANKEVCLEINADKTEYMLLSSCQNAGQILT
jgi:hypothetical protein